MRRIPSNPLTLATPAAAPRHAVSRAGTSLVEVLMSLLVMGIGVVAVATLFPASVLRSVQATQLTNATILRYNAEAVLAAIPELLSIVATPAAGNTTKAIVDPLGYYKTGAEDSTYQGAFGGPGGVTRYCPTTVITSVNTAERITTSEDSWITVLETEITSQPDTTLGKITLPSSAVVSDVPVVAAGSPTPSSFIVFIGEQGSRRSMVMRQITKITGQDVYYTEDLNNNSMLDTGEDFNFNNILDGNALPSGFVVNRVRIESWEPRYNWMLTVRKNDSGVSNVDVVVFFRRSFTTEDEKVYNATYKGTGIYTITVPGGGDPPFWKKGGYLYDLNSGTWHRVQKIDTGSNQVIVENNPSYTPASTKVMFLRGVIEVYPIGNKL